MNTGTATYVQRRDDRHVRGALHARGTCSTGCTVTPATSSFTVAFTPNAAVQQDADRRDEQDPNGSGEHHDDRPRHRTEHQRTGERRVQ